MLEDANVLEDGPALEPTNRLRGLAAVEDFADTVAEAVGMSDNGKRVGGREKVYVPPDHRQAGQGIWADNLLET